MKRSELVDIAIMYYEKKMTQQEIADKLSISRMAVSRAIQKCQVEGIVEIKINYDNTFTDLENEITKKYNLLKTVVVPYDSDDEINREFLRDGAVNALNYFIKDGQYIGIGWGNTLSRLHKHVSNYHNCNNTVFVPLLGGYGNTDYNINSSNITSKIAKVYGGKNLHLHAPAILQSKELKNNLLTDKYIKEVFDIYTNLDMAIIGIGNPSEKSASIYDSGYFSPEDISELTNSNIMCDIVSCIYLNDKGEEQPLEFLRRTVGIPADLFKKIPIRMAVSGGIGKLTANKLAVETMSVNVLVTDEKNAEYLLRT